MHVPVAVMSILVCGYRRLIVVVNECAADPDARRGVPLQGNSRREKKNERCAQKRLEHGGDDDAEIFDTRQRKRFRGYVNPWYFIHESAEVIARKRFMT